jgi:xylose dehydrogenase (NAD/NADP)
MSELAKKIRWGVLGYARIARESLIPAILRSANSEFYALASRDESKRAEARARYAMPQTYGSYEELLRDPQVDAVYIPLPNSLHREWTLQAAAHGKHILCEKPIALNAAQCREMIAACSARGVMLMEAFMYRYTDRTRQVQAVVRSGALGEIKFISASFRFLLANPASIKLRPELGGGSLYDIGCYPVNFAGMVADLIRPAGQKNLAVPESVAAVAHRAGGIDVIFSAVLKYPGGLLASLHSGFNAHKRISAEIIGTEGVLEVPETFFDAPGSLVLTCGDERQEIPVAASDRYRLEVEDFADALLVGRPPQCSLAETLRNMELLDRLFAAL